MQGVGGLRVQAARHTEVRRTEKVSVDRDKFRSSRGQYHELIQSARRISFTTVTRPTSSGLTGLT